MKRFPIRNVRNDFDKIVTLAKIASIVPITDACLERGASAVKHIKSRHSPSQSGQVYSLRDMDTHWPSTLRSIAAATAYIRRRTL